jgi:thiol-disulfide isomerase/thioredoxin
MAAPGADKVTIADARRFIASPIRAREPFAPDFNLRTHESETITNASLRGKVVLLDFWGTWCGPCRASVPMMIDIKKRFAGKNVKIIGISSDDDEDVWNAFIESKRMDWSEYIDLSGRVLQAFKVESFPTYMVLDKDGVVRYRQSGLGDHTQGEIEEALNKALKRESNPALAAAGASAQPGDSAPAPPARSSASTGANSSDAAPATPLSPVEVASITGNIYKNDELDLSYEFPKGWAAAPAGTLHAVNEKSEAAARASLLLQHPELADRVKLSMQKLVFYASKKGEGDGSRLSLPCIRIMAAATRHESLNLEAFRQMSESFANGSGAKVVLPASQFTVKNHPFLRADFERTSGSSHSYSSRIQTLAGEYLLTIELYASNPQDLQMMADSLLNMAITED